MTDARLISTHAPRTGSDCKPVEQEFLNLLFQPTLPARGATAEYLSAIAHRSISTHAPRTGSDNQPGHDARLAGHFNPRSPHGERRG